MTTFLYFVFFHLALVVPSYGYVNKYVAKKTNNGLLLVIVAYISSVLIFGSISAGSYLTGLDNRIGRYILIVYIAYGVYLFIKDKAHTNLARQWFGIGAVVLCSLFATLYVSLPYSSSTLIVPDPEPRQGRNYDTLNVKSLNLSKTQANDNYVPYRQAQFIINKSDIANDSFIEEWGVHFFQRTPLMGTVAAGYFILLNDSLPIDYTWSETGGDPGNTYLKFQLLSHIMNSLFLLPALLLITRLLSAKTATLTILFLIPSQFFLYNNVFSWPKSFTAFFMLLSFYFLLSKNKKSVLLASLVAGLGYLSHDLAILYAGSGFVYLLSEKRYRQSLYYAIIPVLFAAPWFVMSKLLIGRPSSFIYYPFSIHDIPQTDKLNEILKEFFATSPLRLIQIRLESLFYLLSPYQLIYHEGGQLLHRRIWASSIFSVPGSIGYALIVPTVVGLWKRLVPNRFLILVFGPIVLSTIVIGWPKGLGSLHFAQGSVVLLTAIGVHALTKFKNGLLLLPTFLVGMLQLTLFVLFSFDFNVEQWFTSITSMIIITLFSGIAILCSFGIANINKFPKRQK